MNNQKLALRASEARPEVPSIALAASVLTMCLAISSAGAAATQAKQSCSVTSGAQGYWSWRMIDGRKCWYLGKPMLSKAALEWPERTATQPDSKEALASAPEAKHGNPLDAQAYAPADSTSFEALWRDRIEQPKP